MLKILSNLASSYTKITLVFYSKRCICILRTLRIIIISSCYGQSLLYYVEYKYSFMKYKFRIEADENVYHAYDRPDSIPRDQIFTSSASNIIQKYCSAVFAQLYNLSLFQIQFLEILIKLLPTYIPMFQIIFNVLQFSSLISALGWGSKIKNVRSSTTTLVPTGFLHING